MDPDGLWQQQAKKLKEIGADLERSREFIDRLREDNKLQCETNHEVNHNRHRRSSYEKQQGKT